MIRGIERDGLMIEAEKNERKTKDIKQKKPHLGGATKARQTKAALPLSDHGHNDHSHSSLKQEEARKTNDALMSKPNETGDKSGRSARTVRTVEPPHPPPRLKENPRNLPRVGSVKSLTEIFEGRALISSPLSRRRPRWKRSKGETHTDTKTETEDRRKEERRSKDID